MSEKYKTFEDGVQWVRMNIPIEKLRKEHGGDPATALRWYYAFASAEQLHGMATKDVAEMIIDGSMMPSDETIGEMIADTEDEVFEKEMTAFWKENQCSMN